MSGRLLEVMRSLSVTASHQKHTGGQRRATADQAVMESDQFVLGKPRSGDDQGVEIDDREHRPSLMQLGCDVAAKTVLEKILLHVGLPLHTAFDQE